MAVGYLVGLTYPNGNGPLRGRMQKRLQFMGKSERKGFEPLIRL